MDREFHDEWRTLESGARGALQGGAWTIRLGFFPSFRDWITIGIPQVSKGAKIEACRWCRTRDQEAFQTPVERMKHPRPFVPTLESQDAPLDEATLTSDLLKDFAILHVPPIPSSAKITLDGTTLEATLSRGMSQTTFAWSMNAEPEWRPLQDWYVQAWDRLVSELHKHHGPERGWPIFWKDIT